MNISPIASGVTIADEPGTSVRPSSPERPAAAADRSAATERAAASQAQQAKVDPEELQKLADELSKRIGTAGQQLQFSVDRDTGKTILRVTDAESGTVLRQIPGDEALAMARIIDGSQGMLIRQKA